MSRKTYLYIAMSLDGYIAGENDNIDFLSAVDSPGEDYGYAEFIRNIDTVIWGRRTYDKVLSFDADFPHKDKNVYVLSSTRKGRDDRVVFFNDLKALYENLQRQPGKDIYLDGGGGLVFEALQLQMIDHFIISVIPHLLGNGIRLFRDGRPETGIKLKKAVPYPSGLVQLWYDKE